jgi:cytidine deaminase
LTQAALAAAKKSYAPYSKSPSGAAIETAPGRIYKGSYIENAAYNPSLPPLQTALVQLILAGESAANISKAVLVEAENAVITQKSIAQVALSALAPAANLTVVTAKRNA